MRYGFVLLLVFAVGCRYQSKDHRGSMHAKTTEVKTQVMKVLEARSQAIHDKDLDALRNCYIEEVIGFDIGSQTQNFEELSQLWKYCFPHFKNPIGFEWKDLKFEAGDDLAVITYYTRLTGMEIDHPSAKSWIRATTALKRIEGRWKIFHEHASFPVDVMAEKPKYLTDD